MKFRTKYILANTTIYFAVYFIKCFVEWKLLNPFQWILDIPVKDENYRALVMFWVGIHQTCYWLIYFALKDNIKFAKKDE